MECFKPGPIDEYVYAMPESAYWDENEMPHAPDESSCQMDVTYWITMKHCPTRGITHRCH